MLDCFNRATISSSDGKCTDEPWKLNDARTLTFFMSEISMVFNFNYCEGQEVKRSFIEFNGDKISEKGEKLNIEGRKLDSTNIIFEQIGVIIGKNFWSIEPNEKVFRYKFIYDAKLKKEDIYPNSHSAIAIPPKKIKLINSFVIGGIRFGGQILANENGVYVTGETYNKNDGYGKASFLHKFDYKLEEEWILVFDDYHSNNISRMIFWKDKIVITIEVGRRSNKESELKKIIKVINQDGTLFLEKEVGPSQGGDTNLMLRENILTFAFCETGIFNNGGLSNCRLKIVHYNLLTDDLTALKYDSVRTLNSPKFIVFNDSSWFLYGEQTIIRRVSENMSKAFQENYFYPITNQNGEINKLLEYKEEKAGRITGIIQHKEGFTLFSEYDLILNPQNGFFQLDFLDNFGNQLSVEKKTLSDFYVERFSSKTTSFFKNEFWFIGLDSADKKESLIQMDFKGNMVQKIELKKKRNSFIDDFIFFENKLVVLLNGSNDKVVVQLFET